MKILQLILFLSLIGCGNEYKENSFEEFGIVGGRKVIDSRDAVYRSTMAIISNGKVICTGTLIGPNQVVTAAHCIDSITHVGHGFYGGRNMRRVVASIKYPNTRADIALLLFSGSMGSEVRPVSIAPVPRSGRVMLAGYGTTRERGNNRGKLRKVTSSIGQVYGHEFTLRRDGRGACYGDSGGPVFIRNRWGLAVVGATSRQGASRTCNAGDGVFTSVYVFKDWLHRTASRYNVPF